MAKGVRRISGADIGISTTGIAGPNGGTDEKPVGLVYVAVDSDNYSDVKKLLLRGTRAYPLSCLISCTIYGTYRHKKVINL